MIGSGKFNDLGDISFCTGCEPLNAGLWSFVIKAFGKEFKVKIFD